MFYQKASYKRIFNQKIIYRVRLVVVIPIILSHLCSIVAFVKARVKNGEHGEDIFSIIVKAEK